MYNDRHYAVVVGLTDYPHLGAPAANLRGPRNDARAIVDWLLDGTGGGLPKKNIKLIDSAAEGRPTRDDIEAAFLWLNELAGKNQESGLGRRVGERLYIYASGHGFSPARTKGCLFAGNASIDAPGQNVYTSAWLDWFQEAGYFREFVLWMDCCMNRLPSATPSIPPLASRTVLEPPGPTSIAFAARRPLKAVERPFAMADVANPDTCYHGVFTWNLLEGLRGAAANQYGIVTGRSLAHWLRNSQRGWLEASDLADREVAQEPEIIAEDEYLILARGQKPRKFAVRVRLPSAMTNEGCKGRLWQGGTLRPDDIDLETGGSAKLELAPNLYLIELPELNVRHGFEVTRDSEIELVQSGISVDPRPGELFELRVPVPEPGSEIFVIGQNFHLVDRSASDLAVRIPFGLYKIKIRSGRRIVEQTILLDRDTTLTAGGDLPPLPSFSSAAPLPGTQATHEYHEDARMEALKRGPDISLGHGGELLVMARTWTGAQGQETAPAGFEPWEGVRVLNASGQEVARLSSLGVRSADRDPWAICRLELPPGSWFLRQPQAGNGELEQCVMISDGWRTEAHLLIQPPTQEGPSAPRLSLLMSRIGSMSEQPIDKLIDQGRVALADERPVLANELEQLMKDKFANPIAGILAGHLLQIEERQYPGRRAGALNEIVVNLRNVLGSAHPDVEALSLACSDRALRTAVPLSQPPMYEASWRLYVDASQTRPELVPAELWARVHAQTRVAPYFIWFADDAGRKRHISELKAILTRGADRQQPRHGLLETMVAKKGGASPSKGASQLQPKGVRRVPRLVKEPDLEAVRTRASLLGLPPSALDSL